MKMAVFCDIAPYNLLKVHRRFSGLAAYIIRKKRPLTALMESATTSGTSADFHKTTWHNIPEDGHLHTQFVSFVDSNTLKRSRKRTAV
jgi:hypothetical protein